MKQQATIGSKTFGTVEEAMDYFEGFLATATIGMTFASRSKPTTVNGPDRSTLIALHRLHPGVHADLFNRVPRHFSVMLDHYTGKRVFAAHFRGGTCVYFDARLPCCVAFMEDNSVAAFQFIAAESNPTLH